MRESETDKEGAGQNPETRKRARPTLKGVPRAARRDGEKGLGSWRRWAPTRPRPRGRGVVARRSTRDSGRRGWSRAAARATQVCAGGRAPQHARLGSAWLVARAAARATRSSLSSIVLPCRRHQHISGGRWNADAACRRTPRSAPCSRSSAEVGGTPALLAEEPPVRRRVLLQEDHLAVAVAVAVAVPRRAEPSHHIASHRIASRHIRSHRGARNRDETDASARGAEDR